MNQELPQNPGHSDTKNNHTNDTVEALRTGAIKLSESLNKIAETGSTDDIREYIDTLLADTEKATPENERLAAFYLLYKEQKHAIASDLLSYGNDMLLSLHKNNNQVIPELNHAKSGVERGATTLADTYNQNVGRHLRENKVDIRAAARGQEATEQDALGEFKCVQTYAETFDRWSGSQQRDTTDYHERYERGQTHVGALGKASKVVKPDYNEEPKDVSYMFDDTVKAALASRILVELKEADTNGVSPENIVSELLTQPEKSQQLFADVTKIHTFAERQHGLAKTAQSRVDSSSEVVKNIIKTFTIKGRDYAQTRKASEATDIHEQQKRRLRAIDENAHLLTFTGETLVDSANQDLWRLQQSLLAKS